MGEGGIETVISIPSLKSPNAITQLFSYFCGRHWIFFNMKDSPSHFLKIGSLIDPFRRMDRKVASTLPIRLTLRIHPLKLLQGIFGMAVNFTGLKSWHRKHWEMFVFLLMKIRPYFYPQSNQYAHIKLTDTTLLYDQSVVCRFLINDSLVSLI